MAKCASLQKIYLKNQVESNPWRFGRSRDRRRHVTLKGQGRDHNTLRA